MLTFVTIARTRMLRRLLFFIITLVVTVLLAEAAFRTVVVWTFPRLAPFVREEGRRAAGSALRVAKGYTVILDREDFRQPPDLLLLGDSMVFGTLTQEDETFGALLDQERGIRTLNLAVPSASTCESNRMLALALKELSAPPKSVLYSVFANDMDEFPCWSEDQKPPLYVWREDLNRNGKLCIRRLRERVLAHSLTYQFFKRMFSFGHIGMMEKSNLYYYRDAVFEFNFMRPEAWADDMDRLRSAETRRPLIENVLEAKRAAEGAGAVFTTILMPFKEQVYVPGLIAAGKIDAALYDPIYDEGYDRLREELEAEGVAVLDYRQEFRHAAQEGRKLYWTIDAHMNPKGHRLMADLLLGWWDASTASR